MTAGIREVLVITTPTTRPSSSGCSATAPSSGSTSATPSSPARGARPGLPHRRRLHRRPVRRPGARRQHLLRHRPGPAWCERRPDGGRVFAYHVANPAEYGVVEFDNDGRVISIEEKPTAQEQLRGARPLLLRQRRRRDRPRVEPSARGELEITAVNEEYLRGAAASACSRGTAWLDTGSRLDDAGGRVRPGGRGAAGIKIGCIEEVAFRRGLSTPPSCEALAGRYRRVATATTCSACSRTARRAAGPASSAVRAGAPLPFRAAAGGTGRPPR